MELAESDPLYLSKTAFLASFGVRLPCKWASLPMPVVLAAARVLCVTKVRTLL